MSAQSNLPVCPGCDEGIGRAQLQHNSVVDRHGATWHRACAFDDRNLVHTAPKKKCPRCLAISGWVPEGQAPTTERLCPGCGRVFDGEAVEGEGGER